MLEAVRDCEVMGYLLADVTGEQVATENGNATTKVKRGIIRDCLSGSNGRVKRDSWVPRWMAFPASSYMPRGGVGSAERAARIAATDESEIKAEDTDNVEIEAETSDDTEADATLPKAA